MQSNKRQRVDSGNNGRKSFGDNQRKKQYSIVDTKWQPCATAFQSEEANVQLEFNYWMTHRQISDEDVVSFLLSVISNDWSQRHFLVPPANLKHILLVGIHNISPIVLSESIDTLPFLRSCSSVPIHHTLAPDSEDRNNLCMDDVMWKYYDTAPMDSMLFWTSIYPLSSSLTDDKDPLHLFRSFRLLFQITGNNGGDTIGFVSDESVSCDTFSAVAEVIGGASLEVTGRFMLERDGDRGVVLPEFLKSCFAASNVFLILRSDVTEKVYVWEKICHKQHHENNADGFPYALLYDKEPLLKYKLRDADVYMAYQSASDSMYPARLWSQRPSNRINLLQAFVGSDSNDSSEDENDDHDQNDDASKSNGYTASLQHVYFQYETKKASLAKLIAPADVLDLLGYPLVIAPPVSTAAEDGELMESGEEEEEEERHVADSFLEVAALDCEMCCTSAGMEVTRVTVVCPKAGVVLDTLVLPCRPIIDYNTEYSGITAEKMRNVKTTLADVRKQLSQLIGPSTIVVTHSGDGDFKVLRLSHSRVIDTAALFPHPSGLPYKLSLKDLAKIHLNQTVQAGASGHDSIEDSLTAMELALYKAGGQDTVPLPWTTPNGILEKHTIFHEAQLRLHFSQTEATLSRIYLNCASPYASSAKWVQHALGYRAEADPITAAEAYQQTTSGKTFEIFSNQCSSPSDAVNATIQHMQTHPTQRGALWYTDIHHSSSDNSLYALYEASPDSTLMLAVTQGDFAALRLLIARKQRVKWQMNATSLKQQYADVKAVYWTETDEAELIREAAHVIAGAVFLKCKC